MGGYNFLATDDSNMPSKKGNKKNKTRQRAKNSEREQTTVKENSEKASLASPNQATSPTVTNDVREPFIDLKNVVNTVHVNKTIEQAFIPEEKSENENKGFQTKVEEPKPQQNNDDK